MQQPANSASCGDLILASGSPRRSAILKKAGCIFTIVKTRAEEVSIPDDPVKTVTTNALAKLEACKKDHPDSSILAADTIVWFNGKIYGKPESEEEAVKFLEELSGNAHTVFTGAAFCRNDGKPVCKVYSSKVVFKKLSHETIFEYVKKTKPLDRAGAYDIDENGEMLVESFSGSYENIMGLPLEPVFEWIVRPEQVQ